MSKLKEGRERGYQAAMEGKECPSQNSWGLEDVIFGLAKTQDDVDYDRGLREGHAAGKAKRGY